MSALDIDLFDPEVQENWYPAYERLMNEAPVFQMPGTNIYVLTRYDDVYEVLRQPELYSNEHEKYGAAVLFQYQSAKDIYLEKGWRRWHPLSLDPPVQRQYRSIVDPFFRGRGLKTIEPFIRETCANLLDKIAPKGACEFVAEYAVPLPVIVITKMIGFPLEDIPQLKIWSEAWAHPFAGNLSEADEIRVAELGVEFQHYIKDQIDQRRRAPQEDILTTLTQAKLSEGRALSDDEIIHIADHLYIGGNETTTFALSSGLWIMLREREIYDSLIADSSRIPAFVEEVLRLESPTQGLYRVPTEDVTLHGVTIPKGALVHLRYGAANRDPDSFACPHALDLDRNNLKKHMAFSQGPHTCPGAALSRLEQVISHEMMLPNLANLRLTNGRNDFTHLPGFVLRALKELHLSFTAVA